MWITKYLMRHWFRHPKIRTVIHITNVHLIKSCSFSLCKLQNKVRHIQVPAVSFRNEKDDEKRAIGSRYLNPQFLKGVLVAYCKESCICSIVTRCISVSCLENKRILLALIVGNILPLGVLVISSSFAHCYTWANKAHAWNCSARTSSTQN